MQEWLLQQQLQHCVAVKGSIWLEVALTAMGTLTDRILVHSSCCTELAARAGQLSLRAKPSRNGCVLYDETILVKQA